MNILDLGEEHTQRKIGPYVVMGQIAKGATGEVLKARHEDTSQQVALKVLQTAHLDDPAAVKRFEQETLNIGRVKNRNIAQVLDSGVTAEGRPYLVMEFIQGPTLARLIRDKMALATAQKTDLAIQACEGLCAALKARVIHLDIKPSNIMIDSHTHRLKIVDFGLAQAVWDPATPLRSDLIAGTPAYMSPEHCHGTGIDHRSDIYSLGATFYHFLCDQPPFEADTDSALMEKHLREHIVPLGEINPDLPEDLCAIVMRMLSRDPNDRYQDYETLIVDLESAKMSELARKERQFARAEAQVSPDGVPAQAEQSTKAPTLVVAAPTTAASVPAGVRVDVSDVLLDQELIQSRFNPLFLVGGVVLLVAALVAFIVLQGKDGQGRSGPGALAKSIVGFILPAAREEADPVMDEYKENNSRLLAQAAAIRKYRSATGDWPKSARRLVEEGYLTRREAEDAWGARILLYEDDRLIVSAGPDGEEVTSDDWTMTFEGELGRAPTEFKELSGEDQVFRRKGRIK